MADVIVKKVNREISESAFSINDQILTDEEVENFKKGVSLEICESSINRSQNICLRKTITEKSLPRGSMFNRIVEEKKLPYARIACSITLARTLMNKRKCQVGYAIIDGRYEDDRDSKVRVTDDQRKLERSMSKNVVSDRTVGDIAYRTNNMNSGVVEASVIFDSDKSWVFGMTMGTWFRIKDWDDIRVRIESDEIIAKMGRTAMTFRTYYIIQYSDDCPTFKQEVIKPQMVPESLCGVLGKAKNVISYLFESNRKYKVMEKVNRNRMIFDDERIINDEEESVGSSSRIDLLDGRSLNDQFA